MKITRRGGDLLEWPLENRGTAFTTEQRRRLGLLGLLPPNVETLHEQVQRSYEAYRTKTTDMGREPSHRGCRCSAGTGRGTGRADHG